MTSSPTPPPATTATSAAGSSPTELKEEQKPKEEEEEKEQQEDKKAEAAKTAEEKEKEKEAKLTPEERKKLAEERKAAAEAKSLTEPRCDCFYRPFAITYIDRHGTFATAWSALLTLNIIVSICFLIPFRIGFYLREPTIWVGPDVVCDCIFLINIFITLRMSFEQDGEEIRDARKIEDAYLGWPLARDIIGILPLEMISLGLADYEPGLRANRLLFIVLLPDLFGKWERLTTIKPSIIRIWESIFVVFFCTHVMGCIFHLVSMLEGDDALDSFTGTTNLNKQTLVARYFRSVFWSFVTMTGYNNTNPNTLPEAIFSFFVTLMGISLFATIIGSVGSLVTNLDSSKLYFRQKLDSINEYMSYKKIPPHLQDDVRNYFLYLWKSGKGLDKNQALDQLPQYLKHKMNMFLNSDAIKRVKIFEKWQNDTAFVTEVVKNLSSRIYLPNTVVVSKGDIGTEMYFVSHGELNVIGDNDEVTYTFRDGGSFGEIAILLDAKRTATIVARTYCDMSILTKDAFRKVLRRFPDVAVGVKKIAEERMEAAKAASASAESKEKGNIVAAAAAALASVSTGGTALAVPAESAAGKAVSEQVNNDNNNNNINNDDDEEMKEVIGRPNATKAASAAAGDFDNNSKNDNNSNEKRKTSSSNDSREENSVTEEATSSKGVSAENVLLVAPSSSSNNNNNNNNNNQPSSSSSSVTAFPNLMVQQASGDLDEKQAVEEEAEESASTSSILPSGLNVSLLAHEATQPGLAPSPSKSSQNSSGGAGLEEQEGQEEKAASGESVIEHDVEDHEDSSGGGGGNPLVFKAQAPPPEEDD